MIFLVAQKLLWGGGNYDLDSCDSRHKSHLETSHLDSYPKRDYDSLSDDEKCEGYIFHIISDFLSEDSRVRFAKLAQNLSQIYPCGIHIHICDDALFSGLPRLNGNYLTYFRFFIPRFIPKNCAVCLYLDIDMLVVGDLRELFALDMGEKCAGVVKDYMLKNALHKKPKLIAKTSDFKDIDFIGTHFNAGFMLLNLIEWRNKILHKNVLRLWQIIIWICTTKMC